MGLKNFWKLSICVWLSLACTFSSASPDIFSFASARQASQFESLTKELRCLVCQNQSLADSDAPLARDLRQKVYAMVKENKSDREIKDFLVSRYGEFILFSPRVGVKTVLLWAFPGLCLLGVFGVMVWRQRKLAADL